MANVLASDAEPNDAAPDATIEFVLDEEHLREHFREWVAALAPGWRLNFTLSWLAAMASLVLAQVAIFFGPRRLLWLAGLLLALAAWDGLERVLRRGRWLRHARRTRLFGSRVRFAVRDGTLVQDEMVESGLEPKPGTITPTPNGYLFRLPVDPGDEPRRWGLSHETAAVYLPHREIRPPMEPEEFLLLLDLTDAES